MNINRDISELSTGGKATLLGALALCCVVPMLVLFGAVSLAGALFGGGAVVAVGVGGLAMWAWWMGRHHASMTDPVPHGDRRQGDDRGGREGADRT